MFRAKAKDSGQTAHAQADLIIGCSLNIGHAKSHRSTDTRDTVKSQGIFHFNFESDTSYFYYVTRCNLS